ncbi:MAG: bifunctional phosphoribosylaminoimidazolecarboxamide formyltransferase/IMP cyclohydrolase [Balneolaceae bacterium]|nr:bifunctional phosphoribosylaminoimidazolecarboxamide formyltransferase/IMP cyclohydrolase [Balneolaceae bacterium]
MEPSSQPLQPPIDILPIRRALVSVSDKTGLEDFGRQLHSLGVEILSTGGTSSTLREAGVEVTDVSAITGFPEILGGRVKTLHPLVHGAILHRTAHPDDDADLLTHNIQPIDLVVVNLYPFQQTLAKHPDADFQHLIEYIDVGGPTMIRATAKNAAFKAVVCQPSDYEGIVDELVSTGGISWPTRQNLSTKAFQQTAQYEHAISTWMMGHSTESNLTIEASPQHILRYGENPHQDASFYGDVDKLVDVFHGKELSYNNILDLDAGLRLLSEFTQAEPTCAILKHTVPCGVATAATVCEAWTKAYASDPTSPFGGILLFNRQIDIETASSLDEIFSEMVVAPDFSEEAKKLLMQKKNRRLVRLKKYPRSPLQLQSMLDGILAQQRDILDAQEFDFTQDESLDHETKQTAAFAWKITRHVKSNGIVLCNGRQLIGIGTGQTSRVDAVRQALEKAKQYNHDVQGAVLASDAFFPFADNVELAASHGIQTIIQPGGSVRDDDVLEAALKHGITMILTGKRHFRH